jgi:hypothetical protein
MHQRLALLERGSSLLIGLHKPIDGVAQLGDGSATQVPQGLPARDANQTSTMVTADSDGDGKPDPALAELSQFGRFAQANLLKSGKTDAKVFTTAQAGLWVVLEGVEALATL